MTNALVFVMLFAVIGYYVFDPVRWTLVGLVIGLGFGLVAEFGLRGWLYRRRITLVVLLEVVLILAFVGPFILIYAQSIPQPRPVCCIEDSGLGDLVEAVHIPVADSETLAGWYAPPSDDGAVILVLHGGDNDRTGALQHARVLQAMGYGVLVYDQRATGESTGSRLSMGLYDQRDITPIIDWLAARPEVDAERTGGLGLSLGARILVMAAPGEPRLKAVWSDGLGINGIEDVPPYEGISNAFIGFINRQAFWMAGLYFGVEPIPFKRLIPKIAPRHLMLVAGGLDPYEADFNRGYEPYLGENGQLWVIENARHLGGMSVDPSDYEMRMKRFFDTALRQL